MSTETSPNETFAIYVQIRDIVATEEHPSRGDFVRRWQWVILPRLDAKDKRIALRRYQTHTKHRSHWETSWWRDDTDVLLSSMLTTSREPTYDSNVRRVLDTPLVIGATRQEVKDAVEARNTAPWPLLKRAARVSLASGGFLLI